VNDIPVKILKPGAALELENFNNVVDARKGAIGKSALFHHVAVKNATPSDLGALLELINTKVPTNLFSLDISVLQYDEVKDFIKRQFKVVKAAGGLIRKKDKFLMIYRMKKWDLPKGKKEKNETFVEAAEREVEEECNVHVKSGKKICTTWHTYTMNKRSMLKQTKWYAMDLVDDTKMKPSQEEDIEDLRWMTQKEVYHALENSYKSIRFVFGEYYRKTEQLNA
jgi:ADP-ribose pyrophosphatase YjhB (NUDIX family)